jgi:hypothetical protein
MKIRWLLLIAMAVALRGEDAVRGPLVVSERWPECTNLRTWTRDVMRLEGLESASEIAQGKAFFRWLRLFNRMATGGMIQAYEGEPGRERYVTDAHKNLFVYGWGYCDTTSRIAEAAWAEFKNDPAAAERVVVQHDNGGYHTMYRLRLDGHWGAFDARYGYYLIDRDSADARVLDWAEVGDDARIKTNKSYKYRSTPFFEFFGLEWDRAFLIQSKYFASEAAWNAAGSPHEHVFGNRMYRPGIVYHDMDFVLPKGTVVERFWDNSARKFYVPAGSHAKREEAFLPSGRYYRVTETMFDGNWPKHDPNYKYARPYLETVPRDEGYNSQVAGGRTIGQAWGRITLLPQLDSEGLFNFASPFILVDGAIEGIVSGVEVRTQRAKPASATESDVWSDWVPLSSAGPKGFHGVYQFQLRGKPRERFRMRLHFENGIMTLPQIFAGANKIHCKLRDASRLDGRLRIRYRYQTEAGTCEHTQVLRRTDFKDNTASYDFTATGLTRCLSVSIHYE